MTVPTLPAPINDRIRTFLRRKDVRGVFVIWVLLTIALVFFAFVPAHIMGPPASQTKRAIERTVTVFSLSAAPVAAVVWAIAIYSLIRWRRRGKITTPPEDDGPALRNNGPASGIWVVLSSLLCVFLLIWGLAAMQTVNEPAQASDPLVVDVTGQQWLWDFTYPGNGNIQSEQLYLPNRRPIVFHVTSEDVVHSFWIIQLGVKVDANPGENTEVSVIPDRLGTFDIRCAELCGLLHADMQTYVHVVTPQAFNSWVKARGGQVEAG
jgi:cytochrome c oxidase subunit 2